MQFRSKRRRGEKDAVGRRESRSLFRFWTFEDRSWVGRVGSEEWKQVRLVDIMIAGAS